MPTAFSFSVKIGSSQLLFNFYFLLIYILALKNQNSHNKFRILQVTQLPYPLKCKPLGKYRYYEKREEWKITDVLFNPMMMMMVMPLLLVTVLPKMMQDPETKKEMEEMQARMNVQSQIPDMSEMLTSLWGGGAPQSQKKKVPVRRQQQK